MKKVLRVLVILFCGFSVASCATLIHGTSTKITINTDPPGATAKVGNKTFITPSQITVKNKTQSIEITKDGYKTNVVYLEQKMSGWVWGNVLLGGIIGLGIDYLSGGANKIEPTTISVALEPIK